jgi:signal transduction histidine kinase
VDNRFRFQCREDLVIEPEVSTAHFGMIQDALTNIARHAQATHRRATLTRQWKTS